MSPDVKTQVELEIAHILFIDTVGYSKLLINEQRDLLDTLNRVVRNTECFRTAETAGKLIRLPTGDGMALVFADDPEAPVKCALELSQALRDCPQLPIRMGIHSGPVSRVVDVNDRANIAGAGINVAQRVMSCGDTGHILLSKRAAEDLAQYRHWNPYLHEIGDCEVKHGIKVSLVNLYTDELGNRSLPARCAETPPGGTAAERWGAKRIALISLALLVVLALLSAFFLRSRWQRGSTGPTVSEKSIAVLPFLNLSVDKQNSYFTDGVQDEILTDLAKVADLKVISRTSAMQYGSGAARNLREIGKALGVIHILEGSVQRDGNRVRVNAQLIDARTDAHVWADHYERDLADVFAIQSEIAQKIVEQLKAKLSPNEKAAIEQRPTTDLVAYDLYLRGKAKVAAKPFNARVKEDLVEGAQLLDQAVARDPQFFLAYYQLARAHDQIYLLGVDHTPARLALAGAAVKSALRLQPDAGEAHAALAENLYWGYRDYERAREEIALAKHALPNDPLPILLGAYIDRREGRWEQSLQEMKHALELDPRNVNILQQISISYQQLRRYTDMAATLDRALAVVPNDVGIRVQRSVVDLEWRGDAKPLHETIHSIVARDPGAAQDLADTWLYLALCEHDWADVERALTAMPPDGCGTEGVLLPRSWCVGLAARAKGDVKAARSAFSTAHEEAEKTVRDQPAYPEGLCALGLTDAALGRKDNAIREGRLAIELLPIKKDAIEGSVLATYLALIYAWAGEKDLALEQLDKVAKVPGFLSYGQLRLHPYWDPLRGDRRFEQMVAALAPK